MTTGRLWVCDTKQTLLENIKQAAEYYKKMTGKPAQMCLVHPGLLKNAIAEGTAFTTGDITVRPYSNIPAGHLWIGREDEPVIEQAAS